MNLRKGKYIYIYFFYILPLDLSFFLVYPKMAYAFECENIRE